MPERLLRPVFVSSWMENTRPAFCRESDSVKPHQPYILRISELARVQRLLKYSFSTGEFTTATTVPAPSQLLPAARTWLPF